MDLSIIIVSWNTRGMLQDCLASTYSGLADLEAEVFVVDNGSRDGSARMVADMFPSAHLIRNSENRGFAAANNQALLLATGRHILLLNSDTVVHGSVLKASVDWLDSHPDVGVMGCRVLNSDGSLQTTGSRFPTLLNLLLQATGLSRLPGSFFDRYRMQRWDRRDERDIEVVSGCYMMVRREALQEVGLLDEAFFFYGEETDWCLRFKKKGWRLVFAPVGEITHHGGGSVRRFDHMRDVMLSEGTVRLHRKHFGLVGGLACWLVLAAFNITRAIAWTLLGLAGNEANRDRARHFRQVVANIGQTWPSDRPKVAKGF